MITEKDANNKYVAVLKSDKFKAGKSYLIYAASEFEQLSDVKCTENGILTVAFDKQHEYAAVLEHNNLTTNSGVKTGDNNMANILLLVFLVLCSAIVIKKTYYHGKGEA